MEESRIDIIAHQLNSLRDEGGNHSGILFLGAGASKSAGVPLAFEIVQDIDNNPQFSPYVQGCEKSYADYMRKLTPAARKKLLKQYIEKATLSQTYLYAAMLVKAGYIDTVLTVNFDPLILQALAMVNVYPAVYDMAVSRHFILGGVDHPAVVFLHGQSQGFWQLSTDSEMRMALDNIHQLFLNITGTRTWIVVGYSGNDPVFEELAKISNFQNGLYWIANKDSIPNETVRKKLLDDSLKSTWLLRGYDSDSFFRTLKKELKVNEPNILSKPFTHLQESISVIKITDFTLDGESISWTQKISEQIRQAIGIFEEGAEPSEVLAQDAERKEEHWELELLTIYRNGEYEQLEELEPQILAINNEYLRSLLALLYCAYADSVLDEAVSKNNDDELYQKSFAKYAKAVELKPDFHEAYYNWGIALAGLAQAQDNDEALYRESFAKYAKAVEIKADKHEAYYNWGNALADLAKAQDNDEALYRESFAKYAKAVEIKVDKHEAYNNWGIALASLAQAQDNDEALYRESFAKYAKAVEIKADYHEAYNNWGMALLGLAQAQDNDEALYRESFAKYAKAVEIKADKHEAYYNWGNALSDLAKVKDNDEALYRESFAKYAKAVEIKADKHEAYTNWGNALMNLAKIKENDAALLTQAEQKLLAAYAIAPNDNGVLYNLACVYSLLNQRQKALEYLEKALQKGWNDYQHILIDEDFNNIRALPEFEALLQQYFQ